MGTYFTDFGIVPSKCRIRNDDWAGDPGKGEGGEAAVPAAPPAKNDKFPSRIRARTGPNRSIFEGK